MWELMYKSPDFRTVLVNTCSKKSLEKWTTTKVVVGVYFVLCTVFHTVYCVLSVFTVMPDFPGQTLSVMFIKWTVVIPSYLNS